MKNKKIAAIMIAAILSCTFLSCGKSFTLTVAVLDGKGFEVTSSNPAKVEYGDDAEFTLDIEKGETVVAVTSGGEEVKDYNFSDGVLTIKNITHPATLTVSVGDKYTKREFWLQSNASRGGGFTSSVGQGRVADGTVVTVTASPNDGAIFLGWSKNKPIDKGGKLLSREEQYTLKVESDITVFANYDASKVTRNEPPKFVKTEIPKKPSGGVQNNAKRENLVEIVYDANGGKSSDGGLGIKTDFCVDYHTMPNSLPENGSFEREGYVLVGYNTAPDGSGGDIGMGHKFFADYDEPTVLYCMWQTAESEESFVFAENNGFSVISKYNGTSSDVYIPKTLGGRKVGGILSGAFSGKNIKSVYIPSGVLGIEDGAFSGCKNLTEVTFFDNLISVSDAAFEGCPVSTVNLHAARGPRYSDSDLSFGKKFERFAAAQNKRLIIVSGSSKHFGFDSDYAEELLDGKYSVVNYGTNAQMNVVFFLEAMANLADNDDTIVFSPEQYGPFCYTVNGNPEMTALTFQGCESCYQLISHVDMTKYTGVFSAYSAYSKQRSGMKERSYEERSSRIDENGDCSIPRSNLNSNGYRNGANGTFYFKKDTVPAEFAENTNRILSVAHTRGVEVLLSYPPYNINACDSATLNDEGYDAYNSDMETVFDARLISDVRNYIHEGKYFYNTDYHLGEQGTKIHTEQVCKDILAALEQ
ncbi:MAG: leucine-rich repeat domain-containing protein [Clostridia bacterium]|nr:leucine-rich repeat domain-containing protein [Clostridia bacterium]